MLPFSEQAFTEISRQIPVYAVRPSLYVSYIRKSYLLPQIYNSAASLKSLPLASRTEVNGQNNVVMMMGISELFRTFDSVSHWIFGIESFGVEPTSLLIELSLGPLNQPWTRLSNQP